MKKVIEDHYVFRSDYKGRQEVEDGIQTSISQMKYQLQKFIENIIVGKTITKMFLVEWEWTEGIAHYEPYGKILKMNKTPENMTYLLNNKTIMCQHKIFAPINKEKRKMDTRSNVQRY